MERVLWRSSVFMILSILINLPNNVNVELTPQNRSIYQSNAWNKKNNDVLSERPQQIQNIAGRKKKREGEGKFGTLLWASHNLYGGFDLVVRAVEWLCRNDFTPSVGYVDMDYWMYGWRLSVHTQYAGGISSSSRWTDWCVCDWTPTRGAFVFVCIQRVPNVVFSTAVLGVELGSRWFKPGNCRHIPGNNELKYNRCIADEKKTC